MPAENMSGLLTWGTAIAAGGSLVAWIKLWMDFGAMQAKTQAAADAAVLSTAKSDLARSEIAQFKVDVAQTYASQKSLEATEASIERSVEKAVSGIYGRLDGMSARLDNLIMLHREDK